MIAKIKGILEAIIDDHHILVDVAGISYEILLPAVIMKQVRDGYQPGDDIALSTLHEIETAGGFGHLTPRLVGFLTEKERKFFSRLIKVKDFGAKRAIRSMTVPFDQVASAIERGDVNFLVTLPEIGKRSAEKIVAELKGKMTEFTGETDDSIESCSDSKDFPDFKRETLIALLQMGYKEHEAGMMINRAMKKNPNINDSTELLREVFG